MVKANEHREEQEANPRKYQRTKDMPKLRGRLFSRSFAELPREFRLSEHECQAVALGTEQTGRQVALVDIFFYHDDLKEAYYRFIDLADELADRLSFLSYAPATVEIVSLTVPQVVADEEFQIAVPIEGFHRSRVVIDAADIASLDNRPESASIALRMFRRGMSAGTPYQVLTDLWTAIDAICQQEAITQGEYVEEKCPKCQTVRRSGPASQRYIRSAFVEAKSADTTEHYAKSMADDTRKVRNKLVHGSKLHDVDLRREVEDKLSSLQSAVAVGLVRTLNIKTKSHRCQYLGLPYLSLKMRMTGPRPEDAEVLPEQFEVNTHLSFLPDEFSDAQPFNILVGLIMPIPIDPIVLPDVTA